MEQPGGFEGEAASFGAQVGGLGLFAAFALGLVLSGVHPDPRLWGVHQFAFLSRTSWMLATLALILLLVPAVARGVGRASQGLGALLLRSWFVPVAAGLALLAASFTWRMGYQFQGDGMVWVSAFKEGMEFHHFEPLAATLTRAVATAWSPQSPDTAAGILSILLGPLYVVTTAFLCRALFAEALSVGVAWLLLLLHPLLLLFFGYVESYPLLIVLEVLFVLAMVGSSRGRVPLVVPALALGLAMSAHLTALAWSPALVVLAWARNPGRRSLLVGAFHVVLGLVLAITIFGAIGSSPGGLLADLIGESGLGGQSFGWMFSWRHLLDLVNELTLLLAPALVLLAAALWASRSSSKMAAGDGSSGFEAPHWRAILALLPGPLAVAILVEPRIGGGRDWDLYLPLVLPVVLLAVQTWRTAWAVRRDEASPGRRSRNAATEALAGSRLQFLLPVAWADAGRALGLATVAWLGWLAVGVDEGISAQRLEVLQQTQGTFSNFARGYANETLGIYYRGRDSNAAREAWLRATQANPANARYFNNLGIAELRRDNVDAACDAFHRTLELGMEEYFVIFNVANCERRAGEYAIAENHYDRLIAGWPRRWEAFGARGLARVNLGRPSEALDDLRVALGMAPDVAETHYAMGLAHQALGQTEEARRAWQRTLELDPSHSGARQRLELSNQRR